MATAVVVDSRKNRNWRQEDSRIAACFEDLGSPIAQGDFHCRCQGVAGRLRC